MVAPAGRSDVSPCLREGFFHWCVAVPPFLDRQWNRVPEYSFVGAQEATVGTAAA
jgi:hypothetical protein